MAVDQVKIPPVVEITSWDEVALPPLGPIPNAVLFEFGFQLKSWRSGKLSQKELAAEAHVSRLTVARMEHGLLSKASPQQIAAVQSALERRVGLHRNAFYAALLESIQHAA